MDALLRFDNELFALINHLPHTAFTDAVAFLLSGVGNAGIIWFVLAVILFLREEKRDHWFFIPIVAGGALSWLIAERLFKPIVARPRPSPEIGAVILGNALYDYSFPSGHATIAFAAAAILSQKEPRWRQALYLLAILISFSRIYLGKHYPVDILVGALLGWGIGMLSLCMRNLLRRRWAT